MYSRPVNPSKKLGDLHLREAEKEFMMESFLK
jgi:hypothetical protein